MQTTRHCINCWFEEATDNKGICTNVESIHYLEEIKPSDTCDNFLHIHWQEKETDNIREVITMLLTMSDMYNNFRNTELYEQGLNAGKATAYREAASLLEKLIKD